MKINTLQRPDEFYALKLTPSIQKLFLDNAIRLRALKLNDIFYIYKDSIIEPDITYFTGNRIQTMGSFSYSNSNMPHGLRMGRYCSIATNLQIFGARHFVDWISTSPRFYERGFSSITDTQTISHQARSANNIKIANDVWIGQNVTLNKEISIGNGAVIAANAVVTKDVPDFAIVGGVPAKIIGYRFSTEIMEKILKIQWWDYKKDDFRGLQADNPKLFLNELEKRIENKIISKYSPPLLTAENILVLNEFYSLISLLPKIDRLNFPNDFSKNFYQIYINGIPNNIHYELLNNDNKGMFLCLDFEQNSAQNPKYKNFCSEFVQKNNTYAYLHYANRLSINIEVTSKDFVDKFLDLYNKTICFTNL